ncbi:MAG: Type II secretion system F domain protein [Candidatus Woesebacteria bacterium GW2011_GWB1_38_5]|uniref:Type II secretion system F domain protein n=3 Tax=Candidatus Woeseibacteriota TaxID=1752722 RepID=A0A0G0KWF9_9BACT|nr:MAG: Type II secretion system F domain protein [Candidatus Woesebacteria bacterium GW2011_GWC1_38_13]KKQ74772.1 MAG: Type II secretion system F domain protein [Candidatus Woesebacteria bacterium GW2011_GWB1_38_5]KKQ83112.1 MAG: Type II secretion system F domain protein [Candidatus Woesebacteria bacterium GW2011_GWA1_38_8]
MTEYIYEIAQGREVKRGKINAETISEASLQIKKPGWFVVELKEARKERRGFLFFNPKPKFPSYDRINFTDHLASSIGAGTALQEALEAYIEEGDRKSEIIDTINKDIQRGKKLSEAMSKYPSIFSPLYITLVQAGEITGSLDETLEYLANELRREHEFIARVKSAMFYPALVLSVSLVVVTLVIGVVVPKIIAITENFGSDLPAITRIMAKFAGFLVDYASLIVFFFILLTIFFVYILRDRGMRRKINARMTRSPLIGLIMRQFILARFLRIVGGCIKYGIQLPKALELSADVVDNDLYRTACENINKKITRGQNFSTALSDEDKLLFPPIISRTVKGGEKTGKVDVGLMRLSVYYETEVDRNLKRLTEMIEPVMVVSLGALVALIAISVIAPIYQMTSKIK